jgi:hypothetical protein
MEASKAVRFAAAPGWETTQRFQCLFDTLTQKLCQSFLAAERACKPNFICGQPATRYA